MVLNYWFIRSRFIKNVCDILKYYEKEEKNMNCLIYKCVIKNFLCCKLGFFVVIIFLMMFSFRFLSVFICIKLRY